MKDSTKDIIEKAHKFCMLPDNDKLFKEIATFVLENMDNDIIRKALLAEFCNVVNDCYVYCVKNGKTLDEAKDDIVHAVSNNGKLGLHYQPKKTGAKQEVKSEAKLDTKQEVK